jgi:hypothetical protein
VLLSLVTLSACTVSGLFSAGDPTVGLITAQKDLAAEIAADAAGSFTLSVVEDYGQELVVLASDKAYTGTHVWLMDANLKVLQTLSDADIGGAAFSGSQAWFDAWSVTPHRVIIGNQMFGLTGNKLSFLAWTVPQGPGRFFFAVHSGGNYDVAGMYATGNTLVFSRYYDTWLDVSTNPMGVGIGPAPAYTLLALFSDAEAVDTASQAAFLVLRDEGSGTDHFLKIPWNDFMGTLAQPLLSSYELFSRPAADRPELLGYAGGAFLSFARASNSPGGDFVRFDQAGTALPGSLHFERLPDISTAYSLSGTHYFTFDHTTRVVSRRTSWWN